MSTRRRLLLTLPAFVAAAPRLLNGQHLPSSPFHRKAPPPPAPVKVAAYFGTDTDKGVSKGIYRSEFNSEAGQFSEPMLAAAAVRPSFMALSPQRAAGPVLYAANEANEGTGNVSAYAIQPGTGELKLLNQVSSAGAGPCYLSIEGSGRSAFVANYGGSLASFRVHPDGTLSEPVEQIDYRDMEKFGPRGPNKARQDGPHPHSATVSPDSRFLLVNDLGSDSISVYVIDADDARLSHAGQFLFHSGHPGAGPRHVAFHPNGRWIYGINELNSTIEHFLWTTTRSRTSPEGLLINTNSAVKTIEATTSVAKNTAAELAISNDGFFLYASNRGEDSLVVFSIAAGDGRLKLIQRISCGGRTPRHFTLDPTGRWVVCGNQDSATVTVFRRDPGTGRLTGPVQTVALDSPLFTLFV